MIQKHKNLLTEREFEFVCSRNYEVWQNRSIEKIESNYTKWDANLVQDSGGVLIYDLTASSNSKDLQIVELFREKLKPIYDKPIKYVLFHYWMEGSFIPWHSDSASEGAGTLFLSGSWNLNWGGFYLYKTSEETLGAEMPMANTFLLQTEGIEHSVTPIHKGANIRQTVQFFF